MDGTLRRFLGFLTSPGVPGPAWWSVVSRLPMYLMALGLVLVIREQHGGYGYAGLGSACYTVGLGVGGPWVARVIDRHHRPALFVTGAVFPILVVAATWLTGPGPAQLALMAAAGVTQPPVLPYVRGLWARLARDRESLEIAYLWEALLGEALIIGAPLIFAVLMAGFSARAALTVVVILGGIGSWCVAVTTGADTASRQRDGRPRAPFRNRGILALAGVMAACQLPLGMLTLAIPAFLDHDGRGAGSQRVALVFACWGIGSTVAAIWLGQRQSAVEDWRRLPWQILLFAVGIGLLGLTTSDVSLAVALAIGGAPIALISASEMSLCSRLSDQDSLAEGFMWATSATIAGDAVGKQFGGILIDLVGPHGVFVLAFACAAAAFAAAYACRGLFESHIDTNATEVAL
ncbi:MFS transporter [Nocardia sp. NPDC046473]|uniref:MFS transporter n=1 Tax=Nocardia sp. NPDC046473 TaxID=3155733 RepID=UPI0034058931